MHLINVGCGNRFHEDWDNYDFAPSAPSVKKIDLSKSLPFSTGSADAIYSSHVLEHLSPDQADSFLKECHRALKVGGLIRVVVPDLEQVTKEYLHHLALAKAGNLDSQKKYEWIIIELLDQLTRHHSGGEMMKYWMQYPDIPADYCIERVGTEAKGFFDRVELMKRNNSDKQNPKQRPWHSILNFFKRDSKAFQIGEFRTSGEIHRWMYDSYSLSRKLEKAGFKNVRKESADSSHIQNFSKFYLDTLESGHIRKPDSLFMEATKI